jgi:tetratricopeptide (TPR) repeat protein
MSNEQDNGEPFELTPPLSKKERQRQYQKAYRENPEVKERIRQRDKAYRENPEVRERVRQRKKAHRENPEVREQIRQYQKAYRENPENKEQIRQRKKAHRENPENKEQIRQYQKAYRENPEVRERVRGSHRRRRYGLTEDQYRAMYEAQEGRCANPGCRTPLDLLPALYVHVDHCHKSGKVRGILCHNCNKTLGYADDNPKILRGLLRYLKEHGCSG